MRTFQQFLVEKEMALDLAYKTLGVKPSATDSEVTAAWKKLARQHHPDIGGDPEKMKNVNAANDAIQKARKSGSSVAFEDPDDRKARWKDMDEKRAAYAKVAKDAAEAHLKLEPFVQHFSDIFGEQFFVTKREWRGGDPTVAAYEAEFSNKSRTIVADFSLYIDYTELYRGKSLADADSALSMSILSDILVNRKKVKLTQRNYRMENEYKVLYDPEVLFPASKLKSQSAKSVSRKMSKRDVVLTFEKELGAEISYSGPQIWVYVQVGEFRVALYRMTFMGKGAWGVNGVYKKSRREAQPRSFVTMLENQQSMDFLLNNLRMLQGHPAPTAQGVSDDVDAMLATYKSRQKEMFGDD